jgi:hypothetical protein
MLFHNMFSQLCEGVGKSDRGGYAYSTSSSGEEERTVRPRKSESTLGRLPRHRGGRFVAFRRAAVEREVKVTVAVCEEVGWES